MKIEKKEKLKKITGRFSFKKLEKYQFFKKTRIPYWNLFKWGFEFNWKLVLIYDKPDDPAIILSVSFWCAPSLISIWLEIWFLSSAVTSWSFLSKQFSSQELLMFCSCLNDGISSYILESNDSTDFISCISVENFFAKTRTKQYKKFQKQNIVRFQKLWRFFQKKRPVSNNCGVYVKNGLL